MKGVRRDPLKGLRVALLVELAQLVQSSGMAAACCAPGAGQEVCVLFQPPGTLRKERIPEDE